MVSQEVTLSEPAVLQEPGAKPWPSDPIAGLTDANRRALTAVLGTHGLMFEEVVFVANELLDRAQTETHLFAEFVSKLAGSHSMKDWGTMCRECGQHQLDFIRRDCDRYFRHGERVLAATFSLINGQPRLIGPVKNMESDAHEKTQL
jgi:hypothetical protein